MKNLKKKQEKGAIIIEIVAVIALLGVMGPLLFKQISDRNEEIENINIATEIRIIKEALSSYILSHHADIVQECSKTDDLSYSPAPGALAEFLPTGYEDIITGYGMTILLDERKIGGNRLQGFIVPDLESLGLPKMNIRRVARIANLIGADGGIYINNGLLNTTGIINGTGGAWELPVSELPDKFLPEGEHAIVATTGIDTYVPTVEFEDFDPSNIILPDNLALGRLHAWDYFSVGQGPTHSGSCFTLNHRTPAETTTAQNDDIAQAGSGDCDPLFWVGSSSLEAVPSGDVFVKQNLHLRSNPTANSSIVLSSGFTSTPSVNANTDRKISIFNIDGTETLTLDATGKIVSVGTSKPSTSDRLTNSGEYEKLTIQNGRIDSNVKAHNAKTDSGSTDDVPYSLDPRYTSVMNDIRLESRGGARLSEILPTYILKNIQKIQSDGNVEEAFHTIDIPECPNYHYPAIMVTPITWHQYSEQEVIETIIDNVTPNGTVGLTQNGTPKPKTPILPLVKITHNETTETNYLRDDLSGSTGSWNVSLQYSMNGTLYTTKLETPIVAMVHTYCVFDKTLDVVTERPEAEK